MDLAQQRKHAAVLVAFTGILTLAVAVAMAVTAGNPPPLVDRDYPGPGQSPLSIEAPFTSAILWLELPANKAEVFQNLGDPAGEPGQQLRARMDLMNTIDYGFMLAYSALNAALFLLVYVLNREAGRTFFGVSTFFTSGLILAGTMLVGDALETIFLLRLTDYPSPAAIPDGDMLWLSVTTRVKWYALWGACLLLGMGFASYFGASLALVLSLPYSMAGVLGVMSFLVPGALPLLEIATNLMALGWIGSLVYAIVLLRRGTAGPVH